MQEERKKEELCHAEQDEKGWWECHWCGSLWHNDMMGDWWPLSCPRRKKEHTEH